MWLAFMAGPAVGLATAAASRPDAHFKLHPEVQRALDEQGGPVKVWVMFTDKGHASLSSSRTATAKLEASYDARAIQRRRLRRVVPGLFDERDFPVRQAYVDAIRATGVHIRVQSRWLNAVSAEASADQIRAIGALPFVQGVQLVARGRRTPPPIPAELKGPTPAGDSGPRVDLSASELDYGSSEGQLLQINAIALHDLGYTGNGVVLAVLDTGFYKDHESIQSERIIAEWDFIQDDGNTQNETGDPSNQHNHGTTVLSVAAGLKDGQLYGPAYEADLILCKTEDMSQEAPIEEDWYVAGLEFAESHGADVVTSSLGYIDWYTQADLDGQTAVTTVAVNTATDNGVICCTAAGNEGPTSPSLIAPADAFKVITVGAVNSSGTIASFSSRGPTADGRMKPEVVAQGVDTYGASASSPSSYRSPDGTSVATPLVAGTVACLLQAHPQWSVDRIRGALLRTADYYLANGTYDPGYAYGYGLIDALGAHQKQFTPADFDFDDHVDAADLAHLQACTTGPTAGPPAEGCQDADLDGDNDIDQTDFGIWQRCYAGPNTPADPACAQ